MRLGDRMKNNYEKVWNLYLPWRMPVVIRLDGKNFHTLTRNMARPFDEGFVQNMAHLALYVCERTHTTQVAYVQSDEISLLLHPYKKLSTQPYFSNEIQKIVSITAGLASSFFSRLYDREVVFDARCFVLPEDEVVNYFLWRQQDASRNSVSMLAQSLIPHKELHGKNVRIMQEMMFAKHGVNWNNLPTYLRRGFCAVRKDDGWQTDLEIPQFSEDRNYIQKYLEVEEE